MEQEYTFIGGDNLRKFSQQDVAGKCASCRWWVPFEDPVWGSSCLQMSMADAGEPWLAVEFTGLCRRRSPAITDESDGTWPESEWDDWCGDHEAARKHMPLSEVAKAEAHPPRAEGVPAPFA